MQFTCEALLTTPVSAIDIGDWIFGITDTEYQACAKGHRIMGVDGGATRNGVVNVEHVAGILIYQHYKTKLVTRDQVKFLSEHSRGHIANIAPFDMRVTWDMQLRDKPGQGQVLSCTIGMDIPAIIKPLSFLIRANARIHAHLVEETHNFARDIDRKYGTSSQSGSD